MSEPINRGGRWWQQRSDGVWLLWSNESGRWEEQASAPPPEKPPVPAGQWPPAAPVQGAYGPTDPAQQVESGWHQPQGPYGAPPQPPAGYGSPTPGGYEPGGPPVPQLARWWQRGVALLLDGLIVFVPLGILLTIVLGVSDTEAGAGPTGVDFGSTDTASVVTLALLGIVNFVIVPLYYTLYHGSTGGATIGKRIMRLRVADSVTGAPIGFGRAFLRWLVGTALWWLLYIGGILDLLWPLWDERNQALHDKAANSVVVTVPR